MAVAVPQRTRRRARRPPRVQRDCVGLDSDAAGERRKRGGLAAPEAPARGHFLRRIRFWTRSTGFFVLFFPRRSRSHKIEVRAGRVKTGVSDACDTPSPPTV